MTHMFGSVDDCYTGQVGEDDRSDMLEETVEIYEANEEVVYCCLVVGRNVRSRCIEIY